MNQDQVKQSLLKIADVKETFSVIFSGKQSDKVHGLYKPQSREIIIHNRNFQNSNELIYTAIHEFAHHIQFTESPIPVSSRAHTGNFWKIFHDLLKKAEEIKVYVSVFKSESEFIELSNKIRTNFLAVNGKLMQQFGSVLMEASALCKKYHVEFDDYMDRELGFHRLAARTIIKVSTLKINPSVGFDNMKLLSRIHEPEKIKVAEKALLTGQSPDTVRMEFVAKPKSDDKLENLVLEKQRVARTIERLNARLRSLEREIETLSV